MHPLESDAPLIVYLDVKSPYGFVAIRPRVRSGRAVAAPPETVPPGQGEQRFDAFGPPARMKSSVGWWRHAFSRHLQAPRHRLR